MAVSVIKLSLKQSAMDLIMPVQNLYVKILTLKVMVLEDEAFKK